MEPLRADVPDELPLEQRDIKIGPAGWSYKDWEGVVYPARLKQEKHPVEFLAQYFDLIEINTSFYGHIKPELGRFWSRKAKAVNPNFVFTAKLNRTFTHSPVAVIESTSAATIMPNTKDERLAKEGFDSVAAENMLGAVLAQFPVSFKNTDENRAYMESLVQRFRDYPLVIEVRHDTWNDEQTLRYFAQEGIAFCNIDQPLLGRSLKPTTHVTSTIGYVRLHGRNYDEWFDSGGKMKFRDGSSTSSRDDRYNYLYTPPELKGWQTKIDTISSKAKTTFVVTNNHFEGKAVVNGLQLRNMISGERVPVPELLAQRYWDLADIAAK